MQPPILDVWRDLDTGGGRLTRHVSAKHGVWYSGKAFWRRGNNPGAVSIRPDRNRFYDFVSGQGGDSLGLVAVAKGMSLQDAGRYLVKEYNDRPEQGMRKPEVDPDELDKARAWRRGMLDEAEERLAALKAPIAQDADPDPKAEERIKQWTQYRERLIAIDPTVDERAVIGEYRKHLKKQPDWAQYLAQEGSRLEWAVKLAAVTGAETEQATPLQQEPAASV